MSLIQEQISKVQSGLEAACRRAGRDPSEVTLIAVSKTRPVSDIREAYDCGIRDFGENRVQELLEKQPQLPGDIRWHLIGHLQTNKVRSVIGKTVLIHSVDSLHLAECIDRESARAGVTTEVLLEVNAAGEESKFGFRPEELMEQLNALAALEHLRIRGLMTVAPAVEDPEENRPVFAGMRNLAVDITGKNIDNISMDFLSMGMTNDYITASEEGASFVRVGTAIFGEREKNGEFR